MQAIGSLSLMIAAVVAGAVVPFQAGANAALGRMLGHPLWATLVSLGISALCVLPVMLAMRVPLPSFASLAGAPKWIWIGGAAGVFYITAALLLAPKLGAAGFIAAVIAGQMIASISIDQFGLMGFAEKPLSAPRLIGLAFIVVGAVVMQGSSKASSQPAPALIQTTPETAEH
ncbi:DMT family transporter [Pseudaminobacter soli (ex Li et al. 2025)]|uniref:EamA-like transporter family protein n=1 Tax=Pseudaminobacter soli (ex Li et al. 2025) TaxID=1295366 RepID=A0A2P7SDR3_9HYPH|nr:DMT family transporter [Mesorhizobium soli]PSJ60451.1 hypothetical protein C7I85_14200 [Mesorhizobium soli]